MAAEFHGGDDFGGGGGFHDAPGGGFDHASDAGGYEHGTYAGPNGVAHVSDAGGYWHGSAVGGSGYYHGGGYGGYYHQPVVVNSYGGCAGCGWGAGAVVAGAVVAGAAVAASAWPLGVTYGYLPAGCAYGIYGGTPLYQCGAGWLQPAYGANGVYYRVVSAP